jgi:hypothetical protein
MDAPLIASKCPARPEALRQHPEPGFSDGIWFAIATTSRK